MKLSKGFIFTLLAAISWTLSIVGTRVILRAGENPYNLGFWTTILALPYWLFVLLRHTPEVKKLKRHDMSLLLASGLIGSAGITFVEIFALKYSPAINYSFLIRTVIVFTILFAYIFLKEKITRKKFVLACMILGGAYLLTTNGVLIRLSRGDLFTLLEAALIAFGNNVLGKALTNRMSSDVSSSGRFVVGLFPVIIYSTINTTVQLPHMFPLILFLTLMSILIYVFLFKAYKVASASYVTMIMSFTPVFVSFLAVPILKESLSAIQIIGGILMKLHGLKPVVSMLMQAELDRSLAFLDTECTLESSVHHSLLCSHSI
ncbi:DMT family transporter, partial [Candidatus Gottesmanbacteria bacterium]|nr:DMT family transporter [Candidatus Gottesmanbacteria bacterium]